MKNDEQTIRELTLEWLEGWHIEKDKPWSVENFRHLQIEDEVLVIDNPDPTGKLYVFRGTGNYETEWGPGAESGLGNWKIAPEGDIKVKVSGDLAYSSFVFAGGGGREDGIAVKFRQYATFVWERRDGIWKMAIEHLSTDPEYSTLESATLR
jgi:ketosteroid isomerase-like protein